MVKEVVGEGQVGKRRGAMRGDARRGVRLVLVVRGVGACACACVRLHRQPRRCLGRGVGQIGPWQRWSGRSALIALPCAALPCLAGGAPQCGG